MEFTDIANQYSSSQKVSELSQKEQGDKEVKTRRVQKHQDKINHLERKVSSLLPIITR